MVDLASILRLAAAQHGAITRPQLLELGLTARQWHGLVRRGLIEPRGHRTFVVAGLLASAHQRVMVGCLDLAAVASHQTAAWLHGLGRVGPPGRPHVLVRRSTGTFASDLARVHTTTWLPSDDVLEVDGIPCTSVARTLLLLADPGTGTPPAVLRDLVDDAIRQRKATDDWLWWRLEHLRRRGRGGIRAMERVLVDRAAVGPTESWLERAFLALLAAHGLPLPRCQQRIDRQGAFVGRVDFLYEEQRLVIEVSGRAFHASREQLGADAARRNELQLAGCRVMEFTYDDIVRSPARVAATVADALATR